MHSFCSGTGATNVIVWIPHLLTKKKKKKKKGKRKKERKKERRNFYTFYVGAFSGT